MVDLEERTIEQLPERCESCGTPLTDREKQAVIDSGGRALCTTCAAEQVPLDEDAVEEPDL